MTKPFAHGGGEPHIPTKKRGVSLQSNGGHKQAYRAFQSFHYIYREIKIALEKSKHGTWRKNHLKLRAGDKQETKLPNTQFKIWTMETCYLLDT